MYTLLKQRRLRWLGHVCRMEDGRIPNDLLYGELASGKRPTSRPQLHHKDICKGDLKALNLNTNTWETSAAGRCTWRQLVRKDLSCFQEGLSRQAEEKRARRKVRQAAGPTAATPVWASTVIAGAALAPTKTTKGADPWSPKTESCLQNTCTS